MKEKSPNKFLSAMPFIIAILLLIAISATDYFLSEKGFAVNIFYVIPVGLIAWQYGIRQAFIITIISTIIHLGISTVDPEARVTVQVWDAVTLGVVLLVVTVAIDIQRESRIAQRKFTRFIVHDLRSPLTNILSGLQTLKMMAEEDVKEGKKDESFTEIIDMAEISSNRLLTLVNSILDIDKFEHNSMTINCETIAIDEIVEKAKLEVRQWAVQENLNIKYFNDSHLKNIIVDKDLTVRTLVNILSNAIKYSPIGGNITIRVFQKHDNFIRFSVKDEGEGIPKEWQKKIFEKFAQVNGKRSGKPSTGLGLTFCREAITKQGGRIWVNESNTKGTNIIFSLPTDVSSHKSILRRIRKNKKTNE